MADNYVCVIYDDLENAVETIGSMQENIESTLRQIEGIKGQIEKIDVKHGAFTESQDTLNTLGNNFKGYNTTLDFLKEGCEKTSQAFSDTENKNKEEMEKQLAVWTGLLGIEDKISLDDVRFMTRSEYDKLEEDDKLKKHIQEKTNAKTIDGLYDTVLQEYSKDDTGATETDEAETDIDEDEGKDKDDGDSKKRDTYTSPGGSYTGPGSSGTSSGGTSSSGTSASPTYRKVEPSQKNPSQTDDSSSQFRKIEPTETETSKKPATSTTSSDDGVVNVDPQPATSTQQTQTAQTQNEQGTNTGSNTGPNNNTETTTPVQQTSTESQPVSTETPTNTEQHTGAAYSEDTGYQPSYSGYEPTVPNEANDMETPVPELESEGSQNLPIQDSETSVGDIVKGNKYSKIPTSSAIPTTKTSTKSSGGSAFIPIAAGLSAAAAAGIGAKAFLDRKNNNDNDIFEDENWDQEEDIDISIDDTNPEEETLTDEDAYSYNTENTEKYDAKNNEELADIL